jgi:hypothetical protein
LFPPLTVRLILPATEQVAFVTEELLFNAEAGCVIVVFLETEQPFASVTVTMYDPAGRPVLF